MNERQVRTILALIVLVALVGALAVSVGRGHYGFGLGFAVILAGLVVAIALVSPDVRGSGIPVDLDQRRQRMITAAERLVRLNSGAVTGSDLGSADHGAGANGDVQEKLAEAEKSAIETLMTESAEWGWALGQSGSPVDPRQLIAWNGDQQDASPA